MVKVNDVLQVVNEFGARKLETKVSSVNGSVIETPFGRFHNKGKRSFGGKDIFSGDDEIRRYNAILFEGDLSSITLTTVSGKLVKQYDEVKEAARLREIGCAKALEKYNEAKRLLEEANTEYMDFISAHPETANHSVGNG